MKPTYEQLEQQLAAVVAENAAQQAVEFATAPDMWVEQADGMLDYRYVDWYVDVLQAAMQTPATDAAIAKIQAQGVDEIAELYFTLAAHEANRSIADSWRESARSARDHAAQLRQGAEHE